MFRNKDMSKIKNNFKQDFIPSIIEQVESGQMLSNRQMELCNDMMNKKDRRLLKVLYVETGKRELGEVLGWVDMDHKAFGLTKEEAVTELIASGETEHNARDIASFWK